MGQQESFDGEGAKASGGRDDRFAKLFKAAFHDNAQPAALSRMRDGLLVDVNAAWENLTGYSRHEVIGKTTLELGIWRDAARRQAVTQAAAEGGHIDVEATLYAKGGLARSVRFKGTRFDLEGEPHLLGFTTDVTEVAASASEQELREQLGFIERLTARSPVMVYHFRLRTDGSTHFPYVSHAVTKIFGLEAMDVIQDASSAFSRVHPDDVSALHRAIGISAKHLVPWKQEFRVKLRDEEGYQWRYGDSLPMRNADGSISWFGAISDITRQKQQLEELEKTRSLAIEHEGKLQIALDNMSQGILLLGADARIRLHNKHLLEILDIPEHVMASMEDGHELLQFQRERGDFGEQFNFVETTARAALSSDDVTGGPDSYLRKTRAGRTLEVKTFHLPEGGIVRTFSDVTHFVEEQTKSIANEARFRALAELSSDWYWEQDAEHRFVQVLDDSPAERESVVERMAGRRPWEPGSGILLSEREWEQHRQVLASHQVFKDFEFQRRGPDGKVRWTSISGKPVFDADGVFKGYLGVGRDISEQKRREEEVFRLAFYDTLTKLPNRRLLLDRLQNARFAGKRSKNFGALFFIDLDNFKDLNDTLGHDVGDQLLEKVANRLTACVREGDTVARFGGDEFVVMLEGLSADQPEAVEQAEAIGQKVLTTLNMPFDLNGRSHYSTPSIGIALFQGDGESVEDLLKQADLAMYQAKSAGRNTWRFFNPDMQAAAARRAALESDIRIALEQNQFLLYYQPIVDQHTRVVGVEALVRWNHLQRGTVSPEDFIVVAEQSDLILPLGQWVLRAACEQLAVWSRVPEAKGIGIGVNVSAREFHHPDFVSNALAIIRQSGANPNLIKLELTERILLNDVEDAIAKMTELRNLGVRFALDDFGTGYSSLAYLKRLPLDELKIDRSFVRDVLTDGNDAAIARTVIALAHTLGMEVVAEGVETEGQRAFLVNHGCKFFQGYLFGRPIAVDQLLLQRVAPGYRPTEEGKLEP